MALNAYQDGYDTVFIYPDGTKRVPGYMSELIARRGVTVERPRRCYLDLELESDKWSIEQQTMGLAPLICWVVTDDAGNVFSGMGTPGWQRELVYALSRYDQVCAWNGEHYDFLVLQNTVFINGQFEGNPYKAWLWLDQLKVFGRYHLVVNSGEERESLALDHVAQSILGEGKHPIDLKTADRETILKYCIQDAKLLAKLEAKTHYIDLHHKVCELCNCFPDSRSLNPTHFVDSYLSRLAYQHDVATPGRREIVDDTPYLGAYVMQPECVGVQYDVDVIDFASMYPSIMMAYNMSWETVGQPGLTVPKTGVQFGIKHKGMVPLALETLLALRKTYTDEASRTACKVVANSFYGVIGSPYSRFYNREIVESVTHTGRWLTEATRDEARKLGYNVIYADTDSNMVIGRDIDALITHCNTVLYPSMLPDYNNQVRVAHDKHYNRLVFIAAKKYVGVLPDGKLHTKGLEFKRRDACRIARTLQREIVNLFAIQSADLTPFADLIEQYAGRRWVVGDIVLSKKLTRAVTDYKTAGPHVRCASSDARVGDRVSYIVTNGKKSPIEVVALNKYSGKYDEVYYWNKVIYPPTERLLKAIFPNYDWSQYRKGNSQCTLFATSPMICSTSTSSLKKRR